MGATSLFCQLMILYLFGPRPGSPKSAFALVIRCEVLTTLDDQCYSRLALKACLPTDQSFSGHNPAAESRKWTLFNVTIVDADTMTSSTIKLGYFCDLESVDWTRTPGLEHTIRNTSSTRSVMKGILCLLAVNYKLPSSNCTFVLSRERDHAGVRSWLGPENNRQKCFDLRRTAGGINRDAKDAKMLPSECAPSGTNKSADLAVGDMPRGKTLDYNVKVENEGLIRVECCGNLFNLGTAVHLSALAPIKSPAVDSQNGMSPPLEQSGRVAANFNLGSDLNLEEIDSPRGSPQGNVSKIVVDNLLLRGFTCPPGSFGQFCDNDCHCMNRGGCDPQFGICFGKECALGWIGESCDQRQCPEGYYGLGTNQYCAQSCLCGNPKDCDVVTGECRKELCLKTAFTSECAEQLCPRRKLDRKRNCELECHCLNGAVCHPITGLCPGEKFDCAPGYLPPNCTIAADALAWYELSPARTSVVIFVLVILGAKLYHTLMLRLLPKLI